MTSPFGKEYITVTLTNPNRKRLYGTQTFQDTGQVIVFWLGENPPQALTDAVMTLNPGDRVIIRYVYKKSGEYVHKVITSIFHFGTKYTALTRSTSNAF